MLSAVYLINSDGTILIEKQYREHVDRISIEPALSAIHDSINTHPPSIIYHNNYTILILSCGQIWLVGACESDDFAMTSISVLNYLVQLFYFYFPKGITETSVKSNYPSIYQLLDYAIDFGYAFLDESNTIQTALTRQKADPSKGIRLHLDYVHPWRQVNPEHLLNEIYLDAIETLDVVVSQFGKIEFCNITGQCIVNCHLSGDPHIKIVLSPSTHIDDPCYHRCVELQSGIPSNAKVITFIPPDGQFTLVKYRLSAIQKSIPLFISPKFIWKNDFVEFEICLKPESQLPNAIECIEVSFTLPIGVCAPSFVPTTGKTNFDPNTREVKWTIPALKSKDGSIILKGNASLPYDFDLAGRFPIVSAKFSTTGYMLSGFHVESLDVDNVKYKSMSKGIKYITQTNNYEFRTGLC